MLDFVVGYMVPNALGAYPADLDGITASQGRSYLSNDGQNFVLLDSIPSIGGGNFGVRAVVTTGGGGHTPER
jgi:hypothetical protein